MAYTVKRTDGTTLAVIADGSANTSTDLTLIGKNYLNYGTALNENLIRLLENFSNTSAPSKAIKGQLWYDSANSDLKIYDGAGWVYTTTKASTLTVTGNANAGNLRTTGTLTVTGNANVGNIGATTAIITGNANAGNLRTTGILSVTGNANVGNLGTVGLIVATGNVSGGNINATAANGTVTASRLISNITTGTAPLTVSSTTQVANLNVAVAGSLVNGNSNVVVDVNNSVRISSTGNANVFVVTGTGANISGTANITGAISGGTTLSITGNANVGNIGTAALVVTGVSNLNAIGNVKITGGTSGQYISTDGAGNLSFSTVPVGTSIANGTSNISSVSSGNITVSVAGNANILTVTGTGIVVSGTANITGNANVGNLGTAGSITATGNISGGNISTTGANGTITANTHVASGARTGNANVSTVLGTFGGYRAVSATYTDNSAIASATIANVAVHALGTPTIAAANLTVTMTNAATFYIQAPPTAGTNATLTNRYALMIGTGNSAFGGALLPTANGAYDIGSTTARWNNIYGVASSAQYADLAERYHSDAIYEPGTVMALGGENEVTQSNKDLDNKVFGVVSTNPAYLMNDDKDDPLWLPIVLTGRAYVNVVGTVSKGDWLVSAGDGLARAATSEEEVKFNLVIGRSLMNKTINKPAPVEAYICTK